MKMKSKKGSQLHKEAALTGTYRSMGADLPSGNAASSGSLSAGVAKINRTFAGIVMNLCVLD